MGKSDKIVVTWKWNYTSTVQYCTSYFHISTLNGTNVLTYLSNHGINADQVNGIVSHWGASTTNGSRASVQGALEPKWNTSTDVLNFVSQNSNTDTNTTYIATFQFNKISGLGE